MNRILALSVVLTATVVTLSPRAASAQAFKSGRIVTVSDYEIGFAQPAVVGCLEYCMEAVVERQTFDCQGFFFPPIDECYGPWTEGGIIHSLWPTPDPRPIPEDPLHGLCIPTRPEFGGYSLIERAELVEQRVRHKADCTTSITETVLQQLSPTSHLRRPCPDPGPWSSTNEIVRSIRFCP